MILFTWCTSYNKENDLFEGLKNRTLSLWWGYSLKFGSVCVCGKNSKVWLISVPILTEIVHLASFFKYIPLSFHEGVTMTFFAFFLLGWITSQSLLCTIYSAIYSMKKIDHMRVNKKVVYKPVMKLDEINKFREGDKLATNLPK